MAIKTVYKTDSCPQEEWASEQEAMLAEAIDEADFYIDTYKKKAIIAAIKEKYSIFYHNPVKKITVNDLDKIFKETDRELDSYGPSV